MWNDEINQEFKLIKEKVYGAALLKLSEKYKYPIEDLTKIFTSDCKRPPKFSMSTKEGTAFIYEFRALTQEGYEEIFQERKKNIIQEIISKHTKPSEINQSQIEEIGKLSDIISQLTEQMAKLTEQMAELTKKMHHTGG